MSIQYLKPNIAHGIILNAVLLIFVLLIFTPSKIFATNSGEKSVTPSNTLASDSKKHSLFSSVSCQSILSGRGYTLSLRTNKSEQQSFTITYDRRVFVESPHEFASFANLVSTHAPEVIELLLEHQFTVPPLTMIMSKDVNILSSLVTFYVQQRSLGSQFFAIPYEEKPEHEIEQAYTLEGREAEFAWRLGIAIIAEALLASIPDMPPYDSFGDDPRNVWLSELAQRRPTLKSALYQAYERALILQTNLLNVHYTRMVHIVAEMIYADMLEVTPVRESIELVSFSRTFAAFFKIYEAMNPREAAQVLLAASIQFGPIFLANTPKLPPVTRQELQLGGMEAHKAEEIIKDLEEWMVDIQNVDFSNIYDLVLLEGLKQKFQNDRRP